MIKYNFLIFFISFLSLLIQGEKEQLFLRKLKVEENFQPIIHDILEAEKNCDYYDNNLFFSVEFVDNKILFESYKQLNLVLDKFTYGYVSENGNLFFVNSVFPDSLLSYTSFKKEFKISTEKDSNEIHALDGYFSFWEFSVEQNDIKFKNKYLSCQN